MKTLINIMLCALLLLTNQLVLASGDKSDDKKETATILVPKSTDNEPVGMYKSTVVNTVQDFVHIQNKTGMYAVDLFNNDGERVYSFILNGAEMHTFATQNISAGAYTMYVKDVNGTIDIIQIVL